MPPEVASPTVNGAVAVDGAVNVNVNVDPPLLVEREVNALPPVETVGVPKSLARPVVASPAAFITVTVHVKESLTRTIVVPLLTPWHDSVEAAAGYP